MLALSAIATVVVVAFVIQVYKRRNGIFLSNEKETLPVFERSVELLWRGEKQCFCRSKIVLNIKTTPPHTYQYSFITIAHIFGIRDIEHLIIQDADTGLTMKKSSSEEGWILPMVNRKTFYVSVENGSCVTSKYRIKDIASGLGAYERIKRLSLCFYNHIWHLNVDDAFRQHFVRAAEGPEEAADNQSRWLWEMWGGNEPMYSTKHGQGTIFKRMLSRHDVSRMSLDNACSWLKIMKDVSREVFDDAQDKDLITSISLYWLHFLAFFEYTTEERIHFQAILFEDSKPFNS